MLDIKFNVKTPKCEFWGCCYRCSSPHCHCCRCRRRHIQNFIQKINETDINSRRARTHGSATNAFNCTIRLTLSLRLALAAWWLAELAMLASITCSCRLQFHFTRLAAFFLVFSKNSHTQGNSIEMAFRKILIAFARYARCRNNENYDKLRNLWCCSVCVQFSLLVVEGKGLKFS